jgi:hypothetical protein
MSNHLHHHPGERPDPALRDHFLRQYHVGPVDRREFNALCVQLRLVRRQYVTNGQPLNR